jgi:hypothetical protein
MPKGKKAKSLEDLLGRSVKVIFLESNEGRCHTWGKLRASSHPDLFWIEIEGENGSYQTPESILLSRNELELDPDGRAVMVRSTRNIAMDSASVLTGEI